MNKKEKINEIKIQVIRKIFDLYKLTYINNFCTNDRDFCRGIELIL